jgi:hypothetical protein
LQFDGNVDATGIATVLLALATFGLAVYTRRAVRQGATELEQSQRPVLVPFAAGDVRPRFEPILTEGVRRRARLRLPVANVGVGPAMAVRGNVEFGDVRGEPTAAPYVAAHAERTAIGAGQDAFLEFENLGLGKLMSFAFNIEFADVSGKPWFSRGRLAGLCSSLWIVGMDTSMWRSGTPDPGSFGRSSVWRKPSRTALAVSECSSAFLLR